MDTRVWQVAKGLLADAAALPPGQREQFLAEHCPDQSLLSELLDMLATPAGLSQMLDRPSALTPGDVFGGYRIEQLLGRGGMGEVYRARDSRLNRDIALKILPAELTSDPERRRRFEREARAAAALNHPNVVTIYSVEDANGVPFLTMELLEGRPLSRIISSDGMPAKRLLNLTLAMADALSAAHAKGITHRDLKPGNIMVDAHDHVKVLDFGLARFHEIRQDETTAEHTMDGQILGTAAYMSPEQAQGKPIDQRSDLFSLGVILYEMATGERPFRGGSTISTIAAILRDTPPSITDVKPRLPRELSRIVRRCLEKDVERRYQTADDLLEDLHRLRDSLLSGSGDGGSGRGDGVGERAGRDRGSRPVVIAAASVAVATITVIALMYLAPARGAPAAARLSISATGRITPQLSVAVSPDGRRLAFVSTDAGGRSMIWIRSLDSLDAQVVPGTENAAHPFWSPDGQSLGFVAAGKLKRVDLESGSVLTLADTVTRLGGAWSRDGTIIFSPAAQQLASVRASGGPVTRLAPSGAWPSFLPDGRHFLYHSLSPDPNSRGICVGDLGSSQTKLLMTSPFKGVYAAPGYLLFVRDETLMAQSFDADRLELKGDPFVVADGVWGAAAAAQASFSVSPAGTLAYVNASLYVTQLLAFDRSGHPLGPLTPPDRYFNRVPQLSPSGEQVAIARGREGYQSIWAIDVRSGASSHLTLNSGLSDVPVWSSDGARMAFLTTTGAAGESRLNVRNTSGSGEDEVLLELNPPTHGTLWDWSSDGRFVVYSIFSPETKGVSDLWVLPLDGARKPFPFLQSSFHKTQAQIAPNGRWVAYTSYESGRDEVYVQTFPTPGDKRQISVDGGVQPRWRRDGKELFYLASNQALMAVPVTTDGPFTSGSPVPLFRTRLLPQGSQSIVFYTAYDVTADGQRFVLNVPPEDPGPPVTIVLNWTAVGKK